MSDRKKRIKLLTEHRTQQLNDKVAELSQARQAVAEARAEKQHRETVRDAALAQRESSAKQGVSALDWAELNNWLEAKEGAVAQADAAIVSAEKHVELAQAGVMQARAAVKQIEALSERFGQREQREERRREQRAADEHTASQISRSHESS